MLNRNTKLIWREGGREGKRKDHEVGDLRGSRAHVHTCPSCPSTCLGSQGLCFVLTGTGRYSVTGGLQSLLLHSQTRRRKSSLRGGRLIAEATASETGLLRKPPTATLLGTWQELGPGLCPSSFPSLLQGPHFSIEGLPEALLTEDSPALAEQTQPDGVINNLVAEGVISLSLSIPCARKTPEPSQAPLRQ